MYFLGRYKGTHLLGNFLCTKRLNNVLLFVFSFCDLVGRASSVCTSTTTLSTSHYIIVIIIMISLGKTCYSLCPNNMNFFKKQIDTVILKERGRDGGWGQSSSWCSGNNNHVDGDDDDLTFSLPGECLGSVFGNLSCLDITCFLEIIFFLS
jgi:hypothetical protein